MILDIVCLVQNPDQSCNKLLANQIPGSSPSPAPSPQSSPSLSWAAHHCLVLLQALDQGGLPVEHAGHDAVLLLLGEEAGDGCELVASKCEVSHQHLCSFQHLPLVVDGWREMSPPALSVAPPMKCLPHTQ